MRKKLTTLLVLVLCCMCLSGCKDPIEKVGDAISEGVDNLKTTYDEAKVASTKKQMEKARAEGNETYDAMYSENAKEVYKEDAGFFTKAGNGIKSVLSWIPGVPDKWRDKDYVAEKYIEKHPDSEAKVADRMSNTFTAGDNVVVTLDSSLAFLKRNAPVVIIIIAILLILLLFTMVHRRMSDNRAVNRARRIAAATTPPPQNLGDARVNYANVLRINCRRLGLNEGEQIAKYGGVREAAEATNLM